jgi:hypothetical protein
MSTIGAPNESPQQIMMGLYNGINMREGALKVRPQLPVIGVAAGTLGTIRLLVARAHVDDGKVAKYTDCHVMLADVLHR